MPRCGARDRVSRRAHNDAARVVVRPGPCVRIGLGGLMGEDAWWGSDLLASNAPQPAWARSGPDSVMTFQELRVQTAQLARTMACHGIRPGATVAIHGSPSFTQFWLIFALWSIGAQVILLEPSLSRAKREALLDMTSPQYVVTLGELLGGEDVFVPECEVLVRLRPGGRPTRSDHCLVQFSSGTTGRPKAVGRSSRSLLTEVQRLGAIPLMPRAGEQVAVLEPAARSFALIGGVLHALATGATVVFPASGDRAAIVEATANAQVVMGHPGHFTLLASAPEGVRLPLLRLAVSSGEVLAEETADGFARRYGIPIGQAYGTTETGVIATDLAGERGPRTIGVLAPGVRTRLVDGILQVYVPDSPYPYESGPWEGDWLSTHDRVTRDPATGALRLLGRAGQADPYWFRPVEYRGGDKAKAKVSWRRAMPAP
jgi:acyl-coenzyme A synthetase/AMP-(fatty) acid ligase